MDGWSAMINFADRLTGQFQKTRTSKAIEEEVDVAKNHYVTKPKRRNKNNNRKDPSQATMAKLRQLAAAEAKKSGS
jgi:hypothetical protein